MRLVDVVLAGVLVGLIVGYVQMARQGAANAGIVSEAQASASERMTWLRNPALPRRHSSI
ncbi:MAG TPA: hypothetical protein VJ740_06180 [Hyphomicrobiaceae bacterium]|nr:hypothetical protein [Hyphomicrobiaceae bacterium]